jgi:hypothetical protein
MREDEHAPPADSRHASNANAAAKVAPIGQRRPASAVRRFLSRLRQ